MTVSATPYQAAGLQRLKGEMHLHSHHSDGQDSVAAMLHACRAAGYDFVVLTDHNTVSGGPELLAAPGVATLLGAEATTFHGHAVCTGITALPEWRDLERRGMDAFAADVHAQDGLLTVAHPARLGSPVCTGCAWEWPVRPDAVDLWEVFSGGSPSEAELELALTFWQRLLLAGGRAGPVAAGDVHSAAAAAAPRAATYVYTPSPAPMAILAALRERRLFASRGPLIDFWLEAEDGCRTLVGERVAADARWRPCCRLEPPEAWRGARLRALLADRPPRADRALAPTELPVLGTALDVPWGEPLPRWDGVICVYAEVRAADGTLQAVTAPIWIR